MASTSSYGEIRNREGWVDELVWRRWRLGSMAENDAGKGLGTGRRRQKPLSCFQNLQNKRANIIRENCLGIVLLLLIAGVNMKEDGLCWLIGMGDCLLPW